MWLTKTLSVSWPMSLEWRSRMLQLKVVYSCPYRKSTFFCVRSGPGLYSLPWGRVSDADISGLECSLLHDASLSGLRDPGKHYLTQDTNTLPCWRVQFSTTETVITILTDQFPRLRQVTDVLIIVLGSSLYQNKSVDKCLKRAKTTSLENRTKLCQSLPQPGSMKCQ